MLNFKRLFKSFKCAFRGLFEVFKSEQNFRIQAAISLAVIFLMFYFRITAAEKVALLMLIIWVLVLELINSIFERLSDLLKPRIHAYVREIKDIMAATVLVVAAGAAVIGLLIFWKYIF